MFQQDEVDEEMQLPARVAEALMTFVNLDKNSDGVLHFDELREAMESNNLLATERDQAVYSGLVKSDGTISQANFLKGLQMMFGQDSDSTDANNWTASTIYKGLQLLLEAKDDDENDDDEGDVEEIDPQARALANALFQCLDVDGNNLITIDMMRQGLQEVNSDMLSSEIIQEIVAALDDTGSTTVTAEEFTGFFSMLAGTNDLTKVRKNIERYKRAKNIQITGHRESVDRAVSHVRISSRDSSDDTFEDSIEVVNTRTRELERQVRLAKTQAAKINRRYSLMMQENIATEESSQKLAEQNNEMKAELDRNEAQRMEWQDNKEQYKKMAEAMEMRLKKMESELNQAKKDQQFIESEKGKMSIRRPSLVDRLEKNIEEKNALLSKTTDQAKKQEKLLQKANRKQKQIDNKMQQLTEKARKVKILEEQKQRLENENQQLTEKSEKVQQLLNEKAFENDIGLNPNQLASGEIASENILYAHVQSMGGRSLEDVEELAEQTRNIELLLAKQNSLKQDLENKEAELLLAETELLEKEEELMNKDLALSQKDLELMSRESELDAEVRKNQQPLPLIPTDNPSIYMFGTRKVNLQVIQGINYVRVGGGFVRIPEFIKKYNNSEKRKLRQQGLPLPDPDAGRVHSRPRKGRKASSKKKKGKNASSKKGASSGRSKTTPTKVKTASAVKTNAPPGKALSGIGKGSKIQGPGSKIPTGTSTGIPTSGTSTGIPTSGKGKGSSGKGKGSSGKGKGSSGIPRSGIPRSGIPRSGIPTSTSSAT